MSKKKNENYLDYVPVCAPGHSWDCNEKKLVVIHVENKGFYNRLAQKLFKRPKVSHITLDEFGSFVWKEMDGKRTIYEIGLLVKGQFGDKAEPLYERLAQYFQTLYRNHLIGYCKEKPKPE